MSENTIVGPREYITRYAMLGIRFWNSRSDSTSFSNWCVLDENFPERCGRMGKTHRFDWKQVSVDGVWKPIRIYEMAACDWLRITFRIAGIIFEQSPPKPHAENSHYESKQTHFKSTQQNKGPKIIDCAVINAISTNNCLLYFFWQNVYHAIRCFLQIIHDLL